MTTSGDKRHGKTERAAFGRFGRTEIALMGAPCSEIKRIAGQLIEKLKNFKVAYVDADHKTDEEDIPAAMLAGASLIYTDKIKFQRFDFLNQLNTYERNILFNDYDLVLVNGNHFEAEHQLLIVDERKPLEKKLDKIHKPIAIIRQDEQLRLPEYLENHFGKELEVQPLYSLDQLNQVAELIHDLLIMNVPPMIGVVLAGGRSERMGHDKGLIDYHGLPQREYLYHLLDGFTEKTFMSCRPDQKGEFAGNFMAIPDSTSGLGPFGALLSAFREYPNHALLVVACDIPLIDQKAINALLYARNPSKIATAFFNKETNLPDPLLTIWEPKAYLHLLQFLGLGYSCPRKVLINCNTEIVQPANEHWLLNANDPEEYARVKEILKK